MLTATTDASGGFRFPSVPPGLYEVSAHLASFSPQKFTDVNVGLGQIKRLEFALSLAGVQETVSVTAESPIVDIKQNARQVNIRAEQIDLLPRGRDFTTLVTQAPGANQEAKLGGLSIDGASAGENRYIIDGIETTNLQNGLSGKSLIVDFVDEVQVKSSGYTARVRWRHGRRDQRDHQERIEQLPRLRPVLHAGFRNDRRFDAHLAAEAGQLARGRVHYVS